MSRGDAHMDAMLRHLGAAYYDLLHGRAAEADVTRAVRQVEGTTGESPGSQEPAPASRRTGTQHHGRYHSRVRDIMTTSVISVDRITSYKEIASLLAKHQVGGLPVLMLGRHVAGMVTDADLVAAAAHERSGGWLHHGRKRHLLTAEQLMTAPAVTVHPDAPIATAARMMTEHRVRRLPVVEPDGKLIGIVSRRDLVRLFLRPDSEIEGQVTELLTEVLPDHPVAVSASVSGGVVTLAGRPPADWKDEFRLAVKVISELDGVIDIIDKTASPQPA